MKTTKKKVVAKKDTASGVSGTTRETDKVGEIAVHYGFEIIVPPKISTQHLSLAKQWKDHDHYDDAHEKVALLDWHTETGRDNNNNPTLIHYRKPLSGSGTKRKPTEDVYGFEIIGGGKTTGEALVLKAVLAVLSDAGYNNVYVEINSIGDKESVAKFERDMVGFYKKHAGELTAKLRQDFKKDHYVLVKESSKEAEEIRHAIPNTISSLSDTGRIHFKEVLEYLEAFEIPYKINSTILANKHFATHTVFEIRDLDPKNEGRLLAYGYRYNYLSKKMGNKKEIPSIGATVIVKKHPALSKKVIIENIKKPWLYLVQLGNTAKLKALNVIETLRRHKIPVYHSIMKDKITGQLSGAEYLNATHVLILGQKEAIEGTVVVRNLETREQETVAMKELPDFLKKLEKEKGKKK